MSTKIKLASGDVISYDVDSTSETGQSQATIEAIKASIAASTVRPRYRIYVLYPDESIDYEIPISDIKTGGSWSVNYQDGERRSLSFSVHNESGVYTPNINKLWAGTRLRLDIGVEVNLTSGDSATVWFHKGIFVISTIAPSVSTSDKSVSISAKDKYSLFDDKTGTMSSTYEVSTGEDIKGIIQAVMDQSLGNGYRFDPREMIYDHTLEGKLTQAKISLSAGENFGSLLSQLATQLSAEIFYNSEGCLTLVPTLDTINDASKPLLGDFSAENGDFSSLGFSFDMNDIINRVCVVGSTSEGSVHTATAENSDASSPLCYQRIGYRTSIVNDSNITTDLLATERADYELRQKLILKSSTSITVILNPLLEVNNIISLSSDFYGLSHERFLIQGLSGSIDDSGTMSVSVSNINNLPFVS